MRDAHEYLRVVGVTLGVILLPYALKLIRAWFRGGDDDQDPHVDEDSDANGEDDDDDALDQANDDAAMETFFAVWLDPCMMLSCACFDHDNDNGVDLTIAQRHMMDSIAQRLGLQQGMRVLEIESGWGDFALYLVEQYGVHVTGYSRHRTRVAAANRRAEEVSVGAQDVQFVHGEVNEASGRYDRIIRTALSEIDTPIPLEMYSQLLREDGVALVHEATRAHAQRNEPARFSIEREEITNSFQQTLRMWSEALDEGWREGRLVLFEARTRSWRDLLARYSTEIELAARGLDQVVYTKGSEDGAAIRGVARRPDGHVAESDATHLPAAI